MNIRELAKCSGYSTATVSMALRNDPRIAEKTRQRIVQIAEENNYKANPAFSKALHNIRNHRQEPVVSDIAYIHNQQAEVMSANGAFFNELQRGLEQQSKTAGYRLSAFWNHTDGLSGKRIDDILYSRGINGLLLTPGGSLNLDFSRYSVVSIANRFATNRFHQVDNDHRLGMIRCISNCLHLGYERIGIAIPKEYDQYASHAWSSAALWYEYHVPRKDKIPYYEGPEDDEAAFIKWARKHRPSVLITFNSSPFVDYLRLSMTLRIPEDIGLCIVNLKDTDREISGNHLAPANLGIAAVKKLATQLRQNEIGIPEDPTITLTKGEWHEGNTLPRIGDPSAKLGISFILQPDTEL